MSRIVFLHSKHRACPKMLASSFFQDAKCWDMLFFFSNYRRMFSFSPSEARIFVCASEEPEAHSTASRRFNFLTNETN